MIGFGPDMLQDFGSGRFIASQDADKDAVRRKH